MKKLITEKIKLEHDNIMKIDGFFDLTRNKLGIITHIYPVTSYCFSNYNL
jgi:hypothetical protein